ncbi:RING/U-box superfamily protein [Hirschfeldia incana]|nr:RING/U-box superfamily protein [Hirschfeldia incana]
MQGERGSIGSFTEANGSSSNNPVVDQQIRWENLHSIGDNDLQHYMNTATDTNTSFANSVYPEQSNLHRFSLGEASSSGTKNEAPTITEQWMAIRRLEELRNDKDELNPLFMQPPSANRNGDYSEGMNPVIGQPSLFQLNGPENGVRVGSSVDGQRKRKAIDAGIGQSSSHVGFREFHRGESSSLVSASHDHGPRGLVPVTVPNLSAPPAIPERNFSVRVNPGTVARQPLAPSLSAPGGHLPPVDQQLMDLRYRHAFGNYTPLNPNASAASMPPLSRNMIPPFQWSGGPAAAAGGGGSLSSAAPVGRNVVHPVETRERSNMLANPLFVPPPPGMMNLPQGHVNGPGQVALSSSRTSVQPSSPALTPHQSNSAHNQRILSEHLRRRSLLSSLATNHRAARSSAPPASLAQHALQSGGDTAFQALNRAYSRAVPRRGQTTNGIPQSLRGLASTSRGRGRLAELRNVLEQMRRTGALRLEDVMLLNQATLGAAGIQDRYRDMRLDVDNMSYEELLSLGERIGDVCTGLNEETISNRLKQQKYSSDTRCPQEIEPCCICQEEYNEGEELGMLECGHGFHSQCIKEWLQRKNLCPICKTKGLNTVEKPGV